MGFAFDMYGKRSPEFIGGFLAAMDMLAVWKDGQRYVGVLEQPLKKAMQEVVNDLAEVPENFEDIIEKYF